MSRSARDRAVAEFHATKDVLVLAFRALDTDRALLFAEVVEEHRVPAVRVRPAAPVVAQIVRQRSRREPADDLEPQREPRLDEHVFALRAEFLGRTTVAREQVEFVPAEHGAVGEAAFERAIGQLREHRRVDLEQQERGPVPVGEQAFHVEQMRDRAGGGSAEVERAGGPAERVGQGLLRTAGVEAVAGPRRADKDDHGTSRRKRAFDPRELAFLVGIDRVAKVERVLGRDDEAGVQENRAVGPDRQRDRGRAPPVAPSRRGGGTGSPPSQRELGECGE